MAALAVTHPTLLDLAKMTNQSGVIQKIVEIMNEKNEILDDMVWKEGNLTTGHMTTIRTGIPAPTWRKMYQTVQPTKGKTAQITDACGQMMGFSEIDAELARLNGNSAEWRLSEDKVHIEGVAQELATTVFYGSEATQPEAFTGLAPRFNRLSGVANSENVIAGGGAGTDNASIWLVVWGEETVFGFTPKGSTAGIEVEDMGKNIVTDSNGGKIVMLTTQYKQSAGLCVRDWRFVVRIPNIDKSALTNDASSGANLPDLMFQAIRRVPNMTGRPAFYMSRDVMTKLSQQVTNGTKNSTLTAENVGGKLVTKFQGIPVKQCDALAADETLVS